MLLLSLLSLISANLSNPSNAAIFVNTTDTVTIDKMGELKYEIGPGANGVEFVFVKSTLLYLTGVASEKIKITFTFHDDDYHNTPFFLETNNIDITFNCDDPIVFSLRTLNAHKTIFGSTKKVNGHITSNSDCIFDYESFVSAFCPGGVFSTADGGLFSDYHSELQVDLPEDLLEITFSTSAFFVELQNGEKDSFSSVLEKNFNVILKSDLEEITIDASTSTIEGNITILAPKAIITATDRFKNVATATFPVSISCEIILLPYESLPDNIFTFVNEDLEPKDDQIIMMDGYRRYCLYKESSTKCDIHGTIPKAYSSAITVETGKFISYTICTSEAPTIIHDTNSASSLEIIGNNDSRDVNLQIKDVNALSGNFSLENVNIAFTAPQTQLNIKNVFIGKDVTFPNPQQWKMVDFVVSESFNSTFDWYLNFVESLTFDLDLEPNAKIGLYEFNNIENLVITESELKLCYGTSADDCLKFETDSNNRVIVHTNDLKFDLDPAGAKTIFGNFELHIDTKIGDKAQISFFEDWQDVESVVNGPIGIYVNQGHGHFMTAPFDEIPEKFVEYSKSQFTLYSTINTTICLYNSGEEECDPSVIGGKAVKIPSSGQLTVPSGTQYIYKLPSSVPSNLKFSFGKISARNVGFSGSSKSSDKISLKVTDNWINLLRIADVTLTITDNTDKIKIKDYVNHRAALEISSSSSSTKYAVNNSMEITLDEMKSFVDNTDADFDGKTLKLIDTNTIKDVEFTETDWIVTTTNGNTFTLPDYGMTLSIESASEYVTFDITNNAKTLRTLTYTCTDDASLYLTTRWTDTSVSVDSPINIRFTLAKNVKLLHPFAYLDEKIKKLFDLQILINECPYQNTSICVSTDGKSSCGLNGYFIQESFSNLYKVPTGYQFKVYIASDFNCKIGFDSSSAKNVSIIGYNGERSVILSHDSTTPSDILLTLDTVSLSLESSSSIDWKLGSLDIFDSTLSSSNIVKATISGNCSIEMDIFSKLIGSSGIFADGKLHVNGYMTLRDSNEEYLKEIKISETGWTLITSTVTFSVSSSLFKNLIFGVNKPPTSNTHFLPITAESSKISGNLNLNIEEENLYVTIGSDWKNVQSISGSKIYVTATHDKQVPSRFLYYDDSINYQNYFSIDTKRVHALNNATCDVCLLPSDDYANTCFMHERDMLPIITSNKNFLLDQERAYIIFGQSSDTYDFTYLTTKEYSVSVIAANKITVKMNNAPNNVNLHFDSLIDDDGLITLEFEKSMALNSLRFDDSVRISAPSGFKLTLGAMQVDYKSFRRFFREPGIFSTTDSIEINGELNIVDAIDESRYYAIELTSNGWKLIGNDDAWNTTFLRRGTKQTLKLTTLASTINVSAGEESNNYVNALSLMLTRQNTQVYFDSTINDVSSFYNNEKCKIETNSSATFYSSFSTPPSTMFEFKGQITQSYIQPTNTYSLCLYSGSTPCSITGTTPQKIDPSTPFRIKCAKSVSLILTVDASLLIGAESANTIILSGISQTDKKKATLSISEEAPKASLTLNNLVLQLSGDNLEFNSLTSTTSEINSNKNIVISDTLESDYVSLQKLNNIKLTVGKSIIINGNEAPTETGGPEISCESSLDTSVSLSNLGFFTVFALRPNSMTTQTSNEKTVWKFTNMPKDSTFTASYGNNKNIKLNWEGLETDVIPRLSLVLGTSSSVVVGGSHWPQTAKTGETVKISSSFNEISLDLKTPAALEYNNAKIAMHYDSLINLRQTNLLGNSQIGVLVDDDFENIVFGSKSIRLGEFELDRSMNKVGELSVIQNSDDFILQLSLDDSAISDKKIVDLTVQMMKGTKVEFSQGFSEIQSGKVTIDAIDAKIYVDDKVIPSVIDYNPSNVIIVINGKGGVSPGIIVLIVILVIAIVAAIVSLIVYFGFIRRRKLILDAYDNIPDLATDGANDKISMLAQNNEVL